MKGKESRNIIIRPIITEKVTFMAGDKNQVIAFAVRKDANKIEIRKAVEDIFKVKVRNVNTMVVAGKRKRYKLIIGKRPNWKKAIVTLRRGETIEIFDGV